MQCPNVISQIGVGNIDATYWNAGMDRAARFFVYIKRAFLYTFILVACIQKFNFFKHPPKIFHNNGCPPEESSEKLFVFVVKKLLLQKITRLTQIRTPFLYPVTLLMRGEGMNLQGSGGPPRGGTGRRPGGGPSCPRPSCPATVARPRAHPPILDGGGGGVSNVQKTKYIQDSRR